MHMYKFTGFQVKRHQLAGSWDHYTDSNFREHLIIIALLPAIPLDRSMHGAVPFINCEWHHSLPACPSVVTIPAKCAYCTHCVHYSLPTTCLLLLPQGAYCSHCACPMCLLYQLYAYLASALLCQLYSAYYFQCAYYAHCAQCAYYADHAVMYGGRAGMVESRL